MNPIRPSIEEVTRELRSRGIDVPDGKQYLDAFGDSDALSEKLLALIQYGGKRGGAALLWSYEAEREPIPEPGDIAIVLNHRNEPVAITRTVHVAVVPFDQVGADFAAREAEGDSSLAYWREAHWACFGRECERLGRKRDPEMAVVCVSFDLVQWL